MLHFQCAAVMDHKWNLKPQQLLHAGRPAPPRLSLKVQFAGYALAMLTAVWTGSHRFAPPSPHVHSFSAPFGRLSDVPAIPSEDD